MFHAVRSYLFLVILFTSKELSVFGENDDMLGKIKNGLQYAKNYLETAKDIADLVAKSLNKKQPVEKNRVNDDNKSDNKIKDMFKITNLVSAFFRLLGLDSEKIVAITVNSVVFLAQMINSLFEADKKKPNETESTEEPQQSNWDPLNFVLEHKNEKIQNLLRQAQDEELPNQLIDKIDDSDSSCVRLLLCKSSPMIKAAQDSLKNRTRPNTRDITVWLPTREDVESNGDECESKYPNCILFPN